MCFIASHTGRRIGGIKLDINSMQPQSGRMIREDGTVINIANIWADIAAGSGLVKPDNYLYVGKNGGADNEDGSANFPFLNVQDAIDAASSGDTIFIFPGTYAEDLTFKAGVNLTAPAKFSVYITGNHTADFTGTVVLDNIILQSSTGITLSFAGTNAQNLQLKGCSINSGSGDAINWTNTNVSSKILFEDGTCNVSVSGASARCFYSTTGASGSLIANRVSFQVNDPDNVCLSVGGAVSFTHTSDVVVGQMVVSGTASLTSAQVTHTTATQPVLTTTSSGMTVFFSCVDVTTAQPSIAGTGGFSYAGVILGSTGKGVASTINGGLGSIPLDFTPIKFRSASLKPSPIDGMFEYDGTDVYFTIGTTRKKFTLTDIEE
jgi:hypothetical protein